MLKQRSKKVTEADKKAIDRKGLVEKLKSVPVLGWLVCWDPPRDGKVVKQTDLVNAMVAAGLDPKLCRDVLPRSAFARACKTLAEERVIDALSKTNDHITFQFSKRSMVAGTEEREEYEYKKEVLVGLDLDTGKISCRDAEVARQVQAEVDRCVADRTTSDVTNVIQSVFRSDGDLIPWRRGGGVYVVLKEHSGVADRVETMLACLGGGWELHRLPIPAGDTRSETGVQKALTDYIDDAVEELDKAVDEFNVTTRGSTLEERGKAVREARHKVEAYTHYLLPDITKRLLAKLDDTDEKLTKRVEEITEERKTTVNGDGNNGKSGRQPLVVGHSCTPVIRWMGKQGWKLDKVLTALRKAGVTSSDGTIRGIMRDGVTGNYGPPADLSDAEIKELEKLAKG